MSLSIPLKTRDHILELGYVTKLSFTNKNIKCKWEDSPIFKIKEELLEYVSPQGTQDYDLQIPCIPGGRLIMTESSDGENFSSPRVDFYYLMNLESQKERKIVTNVIEKHGLEQIIERLK